jgi:4-hydroxybenzoate polyprenyltransferase
MASISEVESGRKEMSMLRMKSSTLQFLAHTILPLFWSAIAVWASEQKGSSPHGTNIFAPASTPAKSIADLSVFVLVITGIIFVVVFALLLYSVIKFRGRAMDAGREPAQVYGSAQIELAWTNRPASSRGRRLKPSAVLVFGTALAVTGSIYLATAVNLLASMLATLTLLIYLFVYTPLKRKTAMCVLVGAFPGAMPPLIGWAAGSGRLSIEAGFLYAMLFLWRFHISWQSHGCTAKTTTAQAIWFCPRVI